MKRSEMVNAMVSYIWNHYPAHDIEAPIEEVRSFCDSLLKMQESAGMSPPLYYDEGFHDEPECDGMIPEWEANDE